MKKIFSKVIIVAFLIFGTVGTVVLTQVQEADAKVGFDVELLSDEYYFIDFNIEKGEKFVDDGVRGIDTTLVFIGNGTIIDYLEEIELKIMPDSNILYLSNIQWTNTTDWYFFSVSPVGVNTYYSIAIRDYTLIALNDIEFELTARIRITISDEVIVEEPPIEEPLIEDPIDEEPLNNTSFSH